MRKLIIAFIIAFALIAVGLIITLVFAILNGGSGIFGASNMNLVKTENISLDAIDTITISYNSEDVDFYTSDTDKLIFKEYMDYEPQSEELSRIETTGSELIIKDGRERTFINWFTLTRRHRIEIYLPSGFLGKISVQTSSGDIESGTVLKLGLLYAKSSSGNIKMNEVSANSITAEASSGNITFDKAEGSLNLNASSGNIKVTGGVGSNKFNTSSGNITVENASGYIEATSSSGDVKILSSVCGGRFETSSGNITLELTSLTGDLKANASSGNIKLTIPEDAAFSFNADTSSGDIHTYFDSLIDYNKRGNSAHATVGENPGVNIDLETTSGNIKVLD